MTRQVHHAKILSGISASSKCRRRSAPLFAHPSRRVRHRRRLAYVWHVVVVGLTVMLARLLVDHRELGPSLSARERGSSNLAWSTICWKKQPSVDTHAESERGWEGRREGGRDGKKEHQYKSTVSAKKSSRRPTLVGATTKCHFLKQTSRRVLESTVRSGDAPPLLSVCRISYKPWRPRSLSLSQRPRRPAMTSARTRCLISSTSVRSTASR